MPDERDDGPSYKPTQQIPRVQVPQNTLDAVLSEVRATRSDVQMVRADVQTLTHDVTLIKDRVRGVELRVGDLEERGEKHSGGVRQLSETDSKHDAAIAMLHTKVDNLTSIAEQLKAVAGNPMVRRVAYAVGGAILTYLASKGWLVK